MGLTIEDMLVVSKDKYRMEFLAGKKGWSNSISWILLIEDSMVLKDFKGRDLAVTTGLGFDSEEKMLRLVEELVELHAAGLVINTGQYIFDIPKTVITYCDENDLPLLTVPWSVHIFDMIKDLSIRVFLQSETDEQISNALIHAIETPEAKGIYEKDLLPHFDVDGTFQVVLISTGDLDVMDTVERRRISYQVQNYLENITHNGHFFYYDACFALVLNDVTIAQMKDIIEGFVGRAKRKLPAKPLYVGVGSLFYDVTSLKLAYERAKAAVNYAIKNKKPLVYFDEMGFYRLLGMVNDQALLKEMGQLVLQPLLEYDEHHNAEYVETLRCYLENNGSVQAVSEQMFTHRNTVIYRINNIKKILETDLDTAQERLKYQVACRILQM
ncbi:MAG: PucR family transcriptional regulator ligand-binding domain-containing protein [Agathobacter sp.]|nr:PucR family transcriptional regulator ligand-binding domain-containing protein [Agathobacter sp.]